MDKEIEKIMNISGSKHTYQYVLLSLVLVAWINLCIGNISLAFLEKPPDVTYIDPVTGKLVENEQLEYAMCNSDIPYKITKLYDYSWVCEYELGCDKVKTGLLGSLDFVGFMLGSFSFQYIGSYVGRKRVVIVGSIGYCIILALFQFATNVYYIYVCLVIMGCFESIAAVSSYVHISESVHPKRRAYFGAVVNASFCIGGLIYLLLYKYTNSWRWVFLICCISHLITVILYYFFTEESPRFYLMRNDFEKFISNCQRIAKFNGRESIFRKKILNNLSKDGENLIGPSQIDNISNEIDDIINSTLSSKITDLHGNVEEKLNQTNYFEILQKIKQCIENKKNLSQGKNSPGFTSLLKYKSMRTRFIIASIIWFCTSGMYYGVSIYLKKLPGDIFTNGVFFYSIEMIAYLVSGLLVNVPFLGRKRILLIMFLLSGLVYTPLIFFKFDDTTLISLSILGRSCIAIAFNSLYTYSFEIYPTSVRSHGFGFNSASAKIGSIIFPLVIEILIDYLNFIFSGICLLCFCLMFFMPETMGVPLMEEIPEISNKLAEM